LCSFDAANFPQKRKLAMTAINFFSGVTKVNEEREREEQLNLI
jgi:hypothetical protein